MFFLIQLKVYQKKTLTLSINFNVLNSTTMKNLQFNPLSLPIKVNNLLQDNQVVKTKKPKLHIGYDLGTSYMSQDVIYMNEATMAWFLLENNGGKYDIFFKNYDFDKAVKLCGKAALMKITKKLSL